MAGHPSNSWASCSKSEKHDFLRIFELLHLFSNTGTDDDNVDELWHRTINQFKIAGVVVLT